MAFLAISNELIFLVSLCCIAAGSIIATRLGKSALCAFACLLGTLANLLVTKQIILFNLHVTATDAFAVGNLLCLNLMQEFYGGKATKKTIQIGFFVSTAYIALTQAHLWYTPAAVDVMHQHFHAILYLMPRLTLASLVTFLAAQWMDAWLYGFLQRLFQNRAASLRSALSLSCSQLFDTVLFTFLGLYGIAHSLLHIIVVSYLIKLVTIALLTPAMFYAKKFINRP